MGIYTYGNSVIKTGKGKSTTVKSWEPDMQIAVKQFASNARSEVTLSDDFFLVNAESMLVKMDTSGAIKVRASDGINITVTPDQVFLVQENEGPAKVYLFRAASKLSLLDSIVGVDEDDKIKIYKVSSLNFINPSELKSTKSKSIKLRANQLFTVDGILLR